jgi:hypothetical protein
LSPYVAAFWSGFRAGRLFESFEPPSPNIAAALAKSIPITVTP